MGAASPRTAAARWRSLLFVPAHAERFVSSAHERGADAIILDLEDAVPPAEKPGARTGLPDAVRQAGQRCWCGSTPACAPWRRTWMLP